MNRAALLFALVVALSGCEKKSEADGAADGGGAHWTGIEPGSSATERPPIANDPLRAVEEAARDACRCKDAFCASDALERVQDELARRMPSLASADRTRGNEASRRALACATRLGAEPVTRDAGRAYGREVAIEPPPRPIPTTTPTAMPMPTAVARDVKGRAVKLMQSMADAICACKDLTCVTDATKLLGDQMKDMKDLTAEDTATITTASEKMMKCITALTK